MAFEKGASTIFRGETGFEFLPITPAAELSWPRDTLVLILLGEGKAPNAVIYRSSCTQCRRC
jgi:hypothetical protein